VPERFASTRGVASADVGTALDATKTLRDDALLLLPAPRAALPVETATEELEAFAVKPWCCYLLEQITNDTPKLKTIWNHYLQESSQTPRGKKQLADQDMLVRTRKQKCQGSEFSGSAPATEDVADALIRQCLKTSEWRAAVWTDGHPSIQDRQ
jgi:hypothetical protein